ncbi:uncharacterized protein DUF4440 [Flavobacteriaceae bacterium MAR_2010_72]|nr:uncharacterized protein DUF4440 [Flavobacteriaceae bacterium MAR_2010_72]TVZ60204.1 uncharacterized protein DUF4440 [Flavobacteriaceae bacterium MAR_2010_105]
MKRTLLQLVILIGTSALTFGQSLTTLKEINGTWETFALAFDTLDGQLFADIHSKDLIRVSGGQRITDYDAYINNNITRFQNDKTNGVTNTIAFRFFERIHNDSVASERGIYKLVRIANGASQTYYGQFHVLFKKVDEKWLIIMDYDSTEGDTIGEDDFIKAHAIDDFDSFVKQ